MGGYGLGVGLVDGPKDQETLDRLHREVWAIVVRRLFTLVTDPAGVAVLLDYMEAWVEGDEVGGFDERRWFASSDNLSFSFGDAAGLCWGEMYASLHWTELVLLEQWPAVAAAVQRVGARAVPPRRTMTALTLGGGSAGMAVFDLDVSPELGSLLDGRPGEEVFFPFREALAYAATYEGAVLVTPIPNEDEEEISLDDIPEPDRTRIAELVRTGRCACGPCETVRAAR